MKKLFTPIFLLGFIFANAEESSIAPKTDEFLQMVPEAKGPINKGTLYVKAITGSQTNHSSELSPGLGVGYRQAFGRSGVDISFNYSEGSGWSGKEELITWTSPKVSYLFYFAPARSSSLYVGTGAGWGGTSYEKELDNSQDIDEDSRFTGLIPHINVGYEFLRSSAVSSFLELTLSQPLIPRTFRGNAKPMPLLELSVGAGF